MNNPRSKEYDAFGPWILVINEEYTMPPLFKSYEYLLDSAVMMIKIPRHIEWRNANPNMHLYDSVIGVFKTHLLLLYRVGNNVKGRRVEYCEIQAKKSIQCLLLGKLILFTDTATINIEYNTVSENIITEVIELIRKLQNQKIFDCSLSPMQYNIENIEYL